jgi:hypothetical protein
MARLAVVLALLRIVGGAAILAAFGAPRWALAAWAMLHIRVRVGARHSEASRR